MCRESRSVSLPKYDQISGLSKKKARKSPGAGVWFNYQVDILYLRNVWDDHYRVMNEYSPMYGSAQSLTELFLKSIPKDQLRQIQSIALDIFSSLPIMSLHFLEKGEPKGVKNLYLCSEDVDLNVRKIQLRPLEEGHHEYFKSEAKAYFGVPLRRAALGPEGWDIPDVAYIESEGLRWYPHLQMILEWNGSSNLILANAVSPVH